MIKKIWRRHSLALLLFGTPVIWWISSPLFTSNDQREIWYGAAIVAMFMVCLTWFDEAFEIVRDNKTDGPSLQTLAIFLAAFIVLENRTFAVINYKIDNPHWTAASYFPAFIAFQVTGLGILNLVALIRYRKTLHDPKRNQFQNALRWAFTLGSVLGIFYVFLVVPA